MSEEIRRLTYRDAATTIKQRWTIDEDEDQDHVLACELSALIQRLPICRLDQFLAEVVLLALDDTRRDDDERDGRLSAFLAAAEALQEWWTDKDEKLQRFMARSNGQSDGG